MTTPIRTPLFVLLLVAMLTTIGPVPSAFAGHELASEHEVNFDSGSAKKVGEAKMKSITKFFHDAEVAIEHEDINGLMALYSDGYQNGTHTKQEIIPVWKRLFNKFDHIYSKHNMRFITGSANSNMVIIRCSGILMGTPKGQNEAVSIALDYWINNDHILVDENGTWRLIGTAGKEQQRFGFDKPIHPLF